ncbi:MAG: hypothetical protein Q9167_002152 [Letrouitia subvulpina]
MRYMDGFPFRDRFNILHSIHDALRYRLGLAVDVHDPDHGTVGGYDPSGLLYLVEEDRLDPRPFVVRTYEDGTLKEYSCFLQENESGMLYPFLSGGRDGELNSYPVFLQNEDDPGVVTTRCKISATVINFSLSVLVL